MNNKVVLVLPGNNRIDTPSHRTRYELINNLCVKNGYEMTLVDYYNLLGNREFNIVNLIDSLNRSSLPKNIEIVFGISYGCNLLLRLIQNNFLNPELFKRISLWGAYPYWYYHKSLVTDAAQTKSYLEGQGFNIKPENSMRMEMPIEEMIYDYKGELNINIGWGTQDKISNNEFNKYLASLNKKVILHPVDGADHIINKINDNYNTFIFGL